MDLSKNKVGLAAMIAACDTMFPPESSEPVMMIRAQPPVDSMFRMVDEDKPTKFYAKFTKQRGKKGKHA